MPIFESFQKNNLLIIQILRIPQSLTHHKQNIIHYKTIFLINLIQWYKFLSILCSLIPENNNFDFFQLNYILKIRILFIDSYLLNNEMILVS